MSPSSDRWSSLLSLLSLVQHLVDPPALARLHADTAGYIAVVVVVVAGVEVVVVGVVVGRGHRHPG